MSYSPTIEYSETGIPYVTERGKSLGVQVVYCYENARSSGGTYEDDGRSYPARIVYHEIQGYANADAIRRHAYPPHVWYKPQQRILFATVPLSRSAFALYQDPNAPYRTNKARSLQVELEGFSDYVANEPEQWLNNIAEDVLIPFCQWVAKYWGQSINLLNTPGPFVIPGSARTDAPQRFDPNYWATFDGTCAHAHIPMGDDHWDTGAMDLQRIAQHAAYLVGGLLEEATQKEEDEMPDAIFYDTTAYYGCFRSGVVRELCWTEVVLWRDVKETVEYREINVGEGAILKAAIK